MDLITLWVVLTLAKQVCSSPALIGLSVSVWLFVITVTRGLSTCVSGVEVRQPETLMGELWLDCSTLVGGITLGVLASFFSF
jgi:hypothetical protein